MPVRREKTRAWSVRILGDPGLWTMVSLLAVYATTAARGLTLWDSGEFLAAIHSLGIPHPPGTPLYVLSAYVWSLATTPLFGFTLAINLFSSVCMAAAFGIFGHLLYRWVHDRLMAFGGAVCAGGMSTVWLSATETEVYASAVLVSCCILWSANTYRERREFRWMMLTLYLIGIGWALHLTSLLTVPAALYVMYPAFIQQCRQHGTQCDTQHDGQHDRHRDVKRLWGHGLAMVGVVLLGASVVLFLLIRAQHDPAINQGNPSTWDALRAVIQRAQYAVAPLWPRQAPWWLQLGNVVQYTDWQFALGLHDGPRAVGSRTSVTILFTCVAIIGCLVHRSIDRLSWRTLMIVFVTGFIGVVAYLNLKAGPSFGYGILPESAVREARERDYFFIVAFICLGLWAGIGWLALGRRFGRLATIASVVIALTPVALNWPLIWRDRTLASTKVEADATALIAAVPERGIFLAIGDNDTYPLWYLQEVEGFRKDVIVVTVPLLGAEWYREELVRRHALLDSSYTRWSGIAPTLEQLRSQATQQYRQIVQSPLSAGKMISD